MERPIARIVELFAVVLALAGMENWDIANGGNWRSEGGAIVADKKDHRQGREHSRVEALLQVKPL